MTLTIPATLLIPLTLSRRGVVAALVALAMLTSCFVKYEPAVTDAVMFGVIVALPLLGCLSVGPITALFMAAWLTICAASLIAASASPVPVTSLKHDAITLFLATGACALASWLRDSPRERFELALWCYALSAAAATALALIGYFDLLPGAYNTFTLYGRAKGPFKDPNVYAAALPLAIAFLSWRVMRGETRMPVTATLLAVMMLVGLLTSFSRGAWLAGGATLAVVGMFGALVAMTRRDQNRLVAVAAAGTIVGLVAIGAALQSAKVQALLHERLSMTQSYDEGPHGRFAGQAKAAELILQKPFGIGSRAFSEVHHHEEPHQVYLSMFLNAGWLGGLTYLAVVVLTIAAGLAGIMRGGPLRGPFVIATAALIGTALQGFVVDTDHWRHFFIACGLIWGLSDAIPTAKRKLTGYAASPAMRR